MSRAMRAVQLIGAAIGEGAPDHRCRRGPTALRAWGLGRRLATRGRAVRWGPIVHSNPALLEHGPMQVVADFLPRLAAAVRSAVDQGLLPLVIGGDHSCAAATWSALAAALRDARGPQASLGLVWIDAHLDAHTPQTSESSMPHGMPLAALLGYGDPALARLCGDRPKLAPEHVVLVGPRSWEAGEAALLRRLGVRVIDGHEARARGLADCLQEAVRVASTGTDGWGLSFDLDALDPIDAPGTGTRVADGIGLAQACAALHGIAIDERFVGAELVEYNPSLDPDRITAAAAECLLGALVERRSDTAARAAHPLRQARAPG